MPHPPETASNLHSQRWWTKGHPGLRRLHRRDGPAAVGGRTAVRLGLLVSWAVNGNYVRYLSLELGPDGQLLIALKQVTNQRLVVGILFGIL